MRCSNSLVYIIGFMGSGKSTVGRKLASSLGWSFSDLDKEIEKKTGKSIPEIFSDHGEPYFRGLEAEVLRNCGSSADTVIATGGGAPCHGNNMDYMIETGLTVYLKMTPAQLASRLLNSQDERPLLKNIPHDKLHEFIDDKLAQRKQWYERSAITIDGIDADITILSSKIRDYFHYD